MIININITNNVGETPLHYAVRNKNIRLVKLLLENNANLYQKDEFGNTPYSLIINTKENEIYFAIKQYTRAYKKWQKVKIYVKIIIILNKLYKQSLQKLWMPGSGKEYLKCEQDFNNLVNSY